jgi:hypothetical protein
MMTATTKAVREYRALVAMAAALPEDRRWTMGGLIREAMARALVELEARRAYR